MTSWDGSSGSTAVAGTLLDDDVSWMRPIELLRDASIAVDFLWHAALTDGSEIAVQLGEASQGIHRALLALSYP